MQRHFRRSAIRNPGRHESYQYNPHHRHRPRERSCGERMGQKPRTPRRQFYRTLSGHSHLKNVVPTAARLAVLWDAAIGALQFRATETAAGLSRVTLASFPIRNGEEIKDAIAAYERVPAMVVLTSPLIFNQRSQIADLTLKARLPTISLFDSYPKVGGLMAYGPNLASMFKRAASYVDRILSGANVGELPIERPTKFELVINLKTAKALGLEVPWQLQQLADEVIE